MIFSKNLFRFSGFWLRNSSLFLLFVLLFFGLFSYTRADTHTRVEAATSSNLNFQGRLLTDGGNVVPDGYYNLEFKLFNASSSSGSSEGSCAGDANCLWTETRDYPGTDDRVRTVNGYFSVNLGSVTSLPNINWDQDLWLSMNVGGSTTSPDWDGEMSPKIKLTSVPFAQAAKNVYSGNTSSASTDSDDVSILTGNATGATSNSGSITIDVGTATGTTGTISIGTANTSGITIGYVGVLTDIGGDLTVSGSQFTNNGSTLNTAQSLGDFPTGGAIGTAASTVDVSTSFAIAQTTTGQVLTLPNPTVTTAGRMAYVLNTGTESFEMHGATVLNGYGQVFIWNGSTWVLGASGGSAGTVSLQGAYDGGRTLTTSNARDIDITLADTATDSNFIVDIASGSTSEFKIQSNNVDVLQIGSAGQLQLDVQGSSGGITIGGDTNLYRAAPDIIQTDDGFWADWINVNSGGTAAWLNIRSNDGSPAIRTYDSSNNRVFQINDDGELTWGSSGDTNLYKSDSDTLGTDSSFHIQTDSISAFQVQDSGGTNSLLTADTSNNRIVVGDGDDTSGANTTLFVVDSSSTANAPTGVNGGIYYDTTLDRFRCFQNGAWADCVTDIGTTVTDLQSAYDGGNTIATTDGNDIDITLSDSVTTDANLIIDIATDSTGEFKIQSNGVDILQVGSAGQLQLDTQGTGGGIQIGGDTSIYRSASNTLSTGANDSLIVGDELVVGSNEDWAIYQGGSGELSIWSSVSNDVVLNIQGNGQLNLTATTDQALILDTWDGDTDTYVTFRALGTDYWTMGVEDAGDYFLWNDSINDYGLVLSAEGNVHIGDPTADSTGRLFVLDTKNTSGDPTGINGSMYYNSSIDKFRCYENGAWANCGTLPSTGFFQDGTNDTLSDSNTSLWDPGTYPNLTITNDTNQILVSVVIYGSASANDDEYDVFTIHRAVGSNPTCASTQVGTGFVAYTTNSNMPMGTTATFVDTPASTGNIRYTICSSTDANSSGGSVDNIVDDISVTLQESGS